MTGARQALPPQARRARQTLALAFALSLGAVLALYLAGGWRPYVNAPAGFHYGVNSPFEALTLLLPPGWWVLAQQALLILRAALAGCAMGYYLIRHFRSSCRMFAPLCAGYAAAVYTGCIINLVWVDAALLLPLLLSAADRVLRGGGWHPLAVLCFLCVASNCYTAWPLCLFCLLYGLWQLLARPGRLDGRAFGRAVWDLARAMLPGMLLAVILVLPVIVLQYHSDAFQFVADPDAFGFEPMELAYCLFFGRYSAACAADGMPYLYIGSAALLLALCYFLGGDSTRAKFAAAALAAGVAASYLLELPGVSWQNGDDLAVFPFRYGFLLSAMLVIFAADTLVHAPPPTPALGAALFLAAIYLLGYQGTVGSAARTWRLAAAAALYLGCCVLLRLRAKPGWQRRAAVLLALLLLADVVASSCITLYGGFLWL